MIGGKGLSEILGMYPARVPVVVAGAVLREKEVRLMVPRSTAVNSFVGLLRSRGLLKPADRKRAQFLIIDGALAIGGRTFGEIFDARPDPSLGPLEVVVCEESTFGAFLLAQKMFAET